MLSQAKEDEAMPRLYSLSSNHGQPYQPRIAEKVDFRTVLGSGRVEIREGGGATEKTTQV